MPSASSLWSGRRVLFMGSTGFRGSWMTLWVPTARAKVTRLAPGSPTNPSLHDLAALAADVPPHAIHIRDADCVTAVMREGCSAAFLLAASPAV